MILLLTTTVCGLSAKCMISTSSICLRHLRRSYKRNVCFVCVLRPCPFWNYHFAFVSYGVRAVWMEMTAEIGNRSKGWKLNLLSQSFLSLPSCCLCTHTTTTVYTLSSVLRYAFLLFVINTSHCRLPVCHAFILSDSITNSIQVLRASIRSMSCGVVLKVYIY